MARRHGDVSLDQKLRNSGSLVLFRCEGDELHEAATSIKRAVGGLLRGRLDMKWFVGTDEPGGGIKERPLDMKADDQFASEFIGLPEADEVAELVFEGVEGVRDEGDEDAVGTIVP